MKVIKKAKEFMNELISQCPTCLGYGEIPVMGATGQWELMPCPTCSKKEEYEGSPEEFETEPPCVQVKYQEVSPKDEVGKTKMELLLDMPEQIEKLGEILTFGIGKYPIRKGWATRTIDQYKGALLRHLLEYSKGNRIDNETKLPHILHVAINAMFIDYLEDTNGKAS